MLSELRTFVAIARYGTFAQAAERVSLSQAAVSGQVKRLEEWLGFVLFERTGRSAELNDAGYRLLPRVQAILEMVDGLRDWETNTSTGTLRIGAIGSVQSTMLARGMLAFRQAYPNYGVHVIPDMSLQLVDQVDAGEIDLALIIHPSFELSPELSWQVLRREPYVLIARADCAGETWQDVLQSQPLIRYHRLSLGGRKVGRFLRNLAIPISHGVEVPLQVMPAAVRNGLGVAIVPISEPYFPLPADLRLLPIDHEGLHREIGLIRAHTRVSSPALEHLVECLSLAAQPLEQAAPSGPDPKPSPSS